MKSEEALEVRQVALQQQEPTIMALVSQLAQEPTLEKVEVIERLLAMKERQETLQAKRDFIAALTALQAEAPVIQKNGVITDRQGAVRSRYSRIDDIEDIYGPLMQRHGFALTVSVVGITPQGMREFGGNLMHSGGHEKCLSVFLPLDANQSRSAVQSEGSTMSYAKRQLYKAHFNIKEKGVDDDGTGEGLAPISDEQLKTLETLIADARGNKTTFLKLYDIAELAQLPQKYYSAAIDALNQKLRGQK